MLRRGLRDATGEDERAAQAVEVVGAGLGFGRELGHEVPRRLGLQRALARPGAACLSVCVEAKASSTSRIVLALTTISTLLAMALGLVAAVVQARGDVIGRG
jgi:hypothetical protein